MANRYWVGGGSSTNWSATGNTNWSATSGGANNASVPTAGDNVFFDANSGSGTATLNVNPNAGILSWDFTGFTGTLNINAARTITMGGSTSAVAATIFKLSAGMTIGNIGNLSIDIDTRTGGLTITSVGKLNGIAALRTVANSSQTVTIADDTDVGTATFTHQRGTFLVSSGITFTCGTISVTGTGVKGITYSGATIVCGNNVTAGVWSITGTLANCTITGNADSTLRILGAIGTGSFTGGGKTYPGSNAGKGVRFAGTGALGGMCAINDANTFTRMGVDTVCSQLSIAANQTITTFDGTGYDQAHAALICSSVEGTARTLTCTNVNLIDVNLRDITFAGMGGSLSLTRIGNCGNNSGITFTTPTTCYWIGNGGNFGDTAHWSTTSGGSGGQRVPLPQDSVVIDNNSINTASQTITFTNTLNLYSPRYGGINSSGCTTAFTLTLAGSTFGSMVLSAETNLSSGIAFSGNGASYNYSQNGATVASVTVAGINTTVTAQSAVNITGTLNPQGTTTWNTNGYDHIIGTLNTSGIFNGSAMTLTMTNSGNCIVQSGTFNGHASMHYVFSAAGSTSPVLSSIADTITTCTSGTFGFAAGSAISFNTLYIRCTTIAVPSSPGYFKYKWLVRDSSVYASALAFNAILALPCEFIRTVSGDQALENVDVGANITHSIDVSGDPSEEFYVGVNGSDAATAGVTATNSPRVRGSGAVAPG